MANPKHLEILKGGAKAWRDWRKQRPDEVPDLSGSDLSNMKLNKLSFKNANLRGVNLEGARLPATKLDQVDLSNANLRNSDIKNTILRGANLTNADLTGADACSAHLNNAKLIRADLSKAKMRYTQLLDADLSHAILSHADFHNAYLHGANLSFAQIDETNFHGARFGRTVLVDVDFSKVHNLKNAKHGSSSEVSMSTIIKSVGGIPVEFLRGCGLSDWQIENTRLYQRDLSNEEITNILYRIYDLMAHQAIQISPLFISYNHKDSLFVDAMEKSLNEKGIRFWRDVHHATSGRLEKQVSRAIRLNPIVLLVLSKHSVYSDWVQYETRVARKLELETKRDVLCPVALDYSWKDCHWPERLREQIMEYNILNFSDWNTEDSFRHMFNRLIDGLDLFYK